MVHRFTEIVTEDDIEEEVEDGLFVRRRTILALGLSSFSTSFLAQASKAFAGPNADGSFSNFLERANADADRYIGDTSAAGQDFYLRTIAAQAAGLADVPAPANWSDSGQSDGPGTHIGFVPGGEFFVILQWRMDPHTIILPHAHTYGNVVTVGLEGRAVVTNYEVVGTRDYLTDDTFLARRTNEQILGAGDVNLVSLERNYIHGFRSGGEGARGIDITTRLKPKPEHKVPYLYFDAEQLNRSGGGQAFEAQWRRA